MLKEMFILVVLASNACGLIINYEKSENLEKAKTHCPSYARIKEQVDRDKAIEYYKAYLEECPKSINRAKVLTRIGMLYAQYKDEKKEIYPDYSLARNYFEEAIKSAPEFICYETIVARTNLASITEDKDNRFSERLKVLKWLNSISNDQIKKSIKVESDLLTYGLHFHDVTEEQKTEMKEKLNRIEKKAHESYKENEFKRLGSNLSKIKKTSQVNLFYSAFSTLSPEASLKQIILEFKDSDIAKRAHEELNKHLDRSLDKPEIVIGFSGLDTFVGDELLKAGDVTDQNNIKTQETATKPAKDSPDVMQSPVINLEENKKEGAKSRFGLYFAFGSTLILLCFGFGWKYFKPLKK